MRSGKSWLCAELMRTKSGYSDWAVNPKTIWPQWSWERLWRLLQKAKRHRQARHRLTQAHVDYLMRLVGPRRMGEWHKSLRTLRMYGTVRTD